MGSSRTTAFFIVVFVIAAAALVTMGVATSSADKGGCPNANAANGAAHANANSAHGSCGAQQGTATTTSPPTAAPTDTPAPTPEPTPTPSPTPDPTPVPTPSPTPVPGTDTKVVSVTVTAPQATTAGVEFMVSATAALHNNGPATGVLVDTTFTLTLPAGCMAPVNNLVFTVLNRNLPASIAVNITRNWRIVCDATGDHQFDAAVVTAISAGQAWMESNPANNNGAGAASTITSAPTPTPSPSPSPSPAP